MFDSYVQINEQQLAKRIGKDAKFLVQFLYQLNKLELADYQPQKDKPQITFTTQRIAAESIDLRAALINQRKEVAHEKLQAIINYANNKNRCRSKLIVEYFNEFGSEDCGLCDVCLNKLKGDFKTTESDAIEEKLQLLLIQKPLHVTDAVKAIPEYQPEKVTTIIRYLLDNDKLRYNNEHQLIWNSSK
jgi:ATP-dependent DNA helicase RecQ